jgi:hypothetical protein
MTFEQLDDHPDGVMGVGGALECEPQEVPPSSAGSPSD